MSTRIVLIEHPRRSSWVHMNDVANTPLSSSLMTGYVAAALEAAGHGVLVVEGNLGRLSAEEIAARAAVHTPEIIGLHLVYDWSDGAHIRELLAGVLRAVGSVPVLAYGFYPTFAYGDLLWAFPGVTGAILGEPEATVVEAVSSLLRSGPGVGASAEALTRVAGMAALVGDRVVVAPPRPLVQDLDALPAPVRTPEMLSLREVNIAASRGCYGSCTFCTINPFYGDGSHWRPRSPENVVTEMGLVLEEHPHKRRFYFVDPNFFGPRARGRERVLELARLIADRFDVRFGIEGRVNDIDDEVVEALVRAGFDEILIGLESGSDATLARLNKHTSVEQNRRALRILRSHGVEPNVGFIMFEPDSSLADVRVNLRFLEEEGLLDRLSLTANVLYHQQIMLAGTPAFRSAQAEGRLVRSPHNAYEGSIPYRHPEVGFLAETMAEACRHIFAGLPQDVWLEGSAVELGVAGGSAPAVSASGGPARPALDLAGLNTRLVAVFRELLEGLEEGTLAPAPAVAQGVLDDVRGLMAAASA